MSHPPLTVQPAALAHPRRRLGLMAIALAAILWAIAAIVASRLFALGIRPMELATARAVIAAVGLGLLYGRNPLALNWRDRRIAALGASLALVTLTYYIAIDRLPVAVAVVIQYTAPALVVGLNAVRFRRWPPSLTLLAAITALLGVGLVSGLGTQALVFDGVGLLAAGASAFCFANYTLLSDMMVDQYGAIGVMFRGFALSGLFWLGLQITQGVPTAVFQSSALAGVIFVGLGGTLIPFCLLCWGIQQVRVEQGAIAATLEPVMSAVLAWISLGQTLTPLQLLGGGLVLVAVSLLQIRQPPS